MMSPAWVHGGPYFEDLADIKLPAHRTLYFSEVLSDPTNPASPTNFFITVDGATPVLFDPKNPPAIPSGSGGGLDHREQDWGKS
jgi:hypothetical protein